MKFLLRIIGDTSWIHLRCLPSRFLNDLDHIPSSNTSLLSIQSPDSILICKNNLNTYITKTKNIINQVNNIQDKIDSKILSEYHRPYLDKVVQLITKGMLFSENKQSSLNLPSHGLLHWQSLSCPYRFSSYTCYQRRTKSARLQ